MPQSVTASGSHLPQLSPNRVGQEPARKKDDEEVRPAAYSLAYGNPQLSAAYGAPYQYYPGMQPYGMVPSSTTSSKEKKEKKDKDKKDKDKKDKKDKH